MLIASITFAQNFSQTFDEIQVSDERGLGMYISDDGNIYCTVGLVCQDLTVACGQVYKFSHMGDLLWSNLLVDSKIINWENIQIENDSIYVGAARLQGTNDDYCEEIILDPITGEELTSFKSSYTLGLSLGAFGQLIYNDNIYMYGFGLTHDPNDSAGPGYIHRMDKQGNYIDHLEYRQDNYNEIYQLMEGPGEELFFLCSSTSHLTDNDDYRLVKYNPETQETSVIKHFPFQSTHSNFPFYTILSDQFVMTNYIYDYEGILPPLISMVGLSFEGDSLWQFKVDVGNPFEDLRTYDIYEMTSCANDDVLICGGFENGDSNDAGFIMRISKDGELLWERRYWSYDNNGGLRDSYLSAVREMPDGSIVAIGGMQQFSELGAEEDFWILKVDENGCYKEGEDCDEISTDQWLTSVDDIEANDNLVVYPNPANDRINLKAKSIITSTTISALDGTILSIQRHQSKDIRIDIIDYPLGMYYLKIKTDKGEIMKTFVKH